MNALTKFLATFLVAATSAVAVNAQVCSGSFGDPVVNIDFGRGNADYGLPIAETNYNYVARTPNDGQYAIVKSTRGTYETWHQNIANHTPNDPNGYFMLVNADYSPGIFYEKTIPVCPNTTYQFSAYVINVVRNSGIKPRVRFSISYNNITEGASTGDIDYGSPTSWLQKTLVFTVPANITSITLKMTNENPGGNGNDIGIDDITFRACGPLVTSSVENLANIQVCQGGIFNLNADVSNGYDEPSFQWQQYNGTSWVNIPTATNKQTQVDLTGFAPGSYKYRLLVNELRNSGSTTCGVTSTETEILIRPKPEIRTSPVLVCEGNNASLRVNAASLYEWKNANGDWLSDQQTYVIQNASIANAGTYTVKITDAYGCTNTAQVTLSIEPKIVAITNIDRETICEGESVALVGSGGPIIKWSPSIGLSNAQIANPIASPLSTTVYTLTVSSLNNACIATKQVTITVEKKASADAGADKQIIAGQSTTLDGSTTGDAVSYFWTPADNLDNPNSLHPIANPTATTVYTLHAISNGKCTTVTSDQVTVKVYPKIEFPNTFTPNGDGINDNWEIPFIAVFPKARLKIVNRAGSKVFETINGQSWNGKFNGTDQPVGTYYYTLYLDEEHKTYSGWLLLAR